MLHVLIYQVVRLLRNGEFVMGGKRKGDIILLSELIEQVGKDAARFFFLLRSADSDLNFDLDLAVKESPDNPVYYVQYAHARICQHPAHGRGTRRGAARPANHRSHPLDSESEVALIRRLSDFPEEVLTAAELYEPHRLTRYAQDLARDFHVFYDRCPVLKEDTAARAARRPPAAHRRGENRAAQRTDPPRRAARRSGCKRLARHG